MTRHVLISLLCLAPLHAAGVHASSQPQRSDAAILEEFDRRVADYVALHRSLEGAVPTVQRSSDPVEIGKAVESLGTAIRAKRQSARPGDILFPEAAGVFRRIIRDGYGNRLSDLHRMVHTNVPPMNDAEVNGAWPGVAQTMMPPLLQHRLPKLPEGLQFRFVNRDLVIWDSHANLIVDVMRGAIRELT